MFEEHGWREIDYTDLTSDGPSRKRLSHMMDAMQPITTFDATQESLVDLLRSIATGRTQLPDFQRGWVWDDLHIRGVLASISRAFPVGAVMMLQTGNPAVRFKPRLVEGVVLPHAPDPERLILDGQQRLTSLFRVLSSGRPVDTVDARKKPVQRWYYVDIRKVLTPGIEREDAIVSLPNDRILRNFRGGPNQDVSTLAAECQYELFPLGALFDDNRLFEWQMRYCMADPAQVVARQQRWMEFSRVFLSPFKQYLLPVIVMRRETPKEAVCLVFEKVNSGGVALNAFELITATYAADDFNLRDDWEARNKRLSQKHVLRGILSTDLLQVIALLASKKRRDEAIRGGVPPENAPGIGCKSRDLLDLSLDNYRAWAEPATLGFERAAQFLHGLGLYGSRDLPYRSQLVPLAATFASLGDDWQDARVTDPIARWYWCGVFGELYGSATEFRFTRDLPELLAWIAGGVEPSTVQEATFSAARLLRLRTRNSAAYKGLFALVLRKALDLRTGLSIDEHQYFDDKIDIHHIFPKRWCAGQGIPTATADSIVNKTPLSARTNRIIGHSAPSVYFAKLAAKFPGAAPALSNALTTHAVDTSLLRADRFQDFMQARSAALLAVVAAAMGKSLTALSLPAATAEEDGDEVDDSTDDTDDDAPDSVG